MQYKFLPDHFSATFRIIIVKRFSPILCLSSLITTTIYMSKLKFPLHNVAHINSWHWILCNVVRRHLSEPDGHRKKVKQKKATRYRHSTTQLDMQRVITPDRLLSSQKKESSFTFYSRLTRYLSIIGACIQTVMTTWTLVFTVLQFSAK